MQYSISIQSYTLILGVQHGGFKLKLIDDVSSEVWEKTFESQYIEELT